MNFSVIKLDGAGASLSISILRRRRAGAVSSGRTASGPGTTRPRPPRRWSGGWPRR